MIYIITCIKLIQAYLFYTACKRCLPLNDSWTSKIVKTFKRSALLFTHTGDKKEWLIEIENANFWKALKWFLIWTVIAIVVSTYALLK